ncbi:MAG: ArgR family transcriptional regulator [Acidobacteria bacterium]|nr:ArgR family transcriptional regulator [Acidobacteriota bacterium]
MPKRLRHGRILELVAAEPLVSQEQLRRRLAQQGIRVTQATLSRDLKELGLVKTPQGYARPAVVAEPTAPPPLPLPHLLQEFVLDIRPAMNLLVVKTGPGSAQPVAAALDSQQWNEVVGTIAGDDTVLVVTPTRKACQQVGARLRELIA